MAGLTLAGFEIKILQEILTDVQEDEKNRLHPAIVVSTTSALGQLNGVMAERDALFWELLRFAYGSNDPDQAEGWLLDALCALTGTVRRQATRSRVVCDVNLDAGVTLPQYSTAHVLNQPLRIFRSAAEFGPTVTAGVYQVTFEAEETGPVPANANTLTQIAGPVTGWNAISNPLDASLGINRDTDAILRVRREEGLQRNGGSTPDAIRSDLLAITGVQKVTVFENLSDTEDENGVPPFSLEILVFDGIVPTVDNDLIAQAIWDTRAAGANTSGTESGNAIDSEGNGHVIRFTRPAIRYVYIDASVDVTANAPVGVDTLLRDLFVTEANSLFVQGFDVVALEMRSILMDMKEQYGYTWIHDVPNLKLAFTGSPTNEANLIVSEREIAQVDTSRTVIRLV